MLRLNTKIAFLVVLDCCFFKIVYKHVTHLRGGNCAMASWRSFPISLTPAVCYVLIVGVRTQRMCQVLGENEIKE